MSELISQANELLLHCDTKHVKRFREIISVDSENHSENMDKVNSVLEMQSF